MREFLNHIKVQLKEENPLKYAYRVMTIPQAISIYNLIVGNLLKNCRKIILIKAALNFLQNGLEKITFLLQFKLEEKWTKFER